MFVIVNQNSFKMDRLKIETIECPTRFPDLLPLDIFVLGKFQGSAGPLWNCQMQWKHLFLILRLITVKYTEITIRKQKVCDFRLKITNIKCINVC